MSHSETSHFECLNLKRLKLRIRILILIHGMNFAMQVPCQRLNLIHGTKIAMQIVCQRLTLKHWHDSCKEGGTTKIVTSP